MTAIALPRPRALHWTALVVLLAATVLRLWALDASPLWCDEGNNAYFAQQSPAELLRTSVLTRDTDPPAHRLALALWLRLLGPGALQLRLLSALAGLGTVALVFLWAQDLGGSGAGVLSALLAALAPMLVYYSREAKAYPFVAFFALVALYLWPRILHAQGYRRWLLWLLYVLAQALALGAHYYALLFMAAQGVWLAAGLLRARARRPQLRVLGLWLLAQGATALLVLPWVAQALPSTLAGARDVSGHAALSLPAYLGAVLRELAAGPGAPLVPALVALVVLLVGAGLGALHRRGAGAGLLGSAVLVSLLAGFVAQRFVSFFFPRFLLYALPPLCLLCGLGLAGLRRTGYLLVAVLVAAWVSVLPNALHLHVPPEEDLRPVAAALRSQAAAGDGVVVTYVWQEGILRLLAPEAPVSYYLGWFEDDTVAAEMAALYARYRRLWLVTYDVPLQHPQNTGGWWLEQHTARILAVEAGRNRAVLYSAPPAGPPADGEVAVFADAIRLGGVLPDRVAPGEALLVSLSWQVQQPAGDPTVFVHLYDAAGSLSAQADGPPANGLRPLSSIALGETVSDCRALIVPAAAVPGRYTLVVGLYDPSTGQRLMVTQGADAGKDGARLGSVTVIAPAP